MPLTRRQFELGIDEEIEAWMQQVYHLLANIRDLAYSELELRQNILGEGGRVAHVTQGERKAKFQRALDVLVFVEAIERRQVDGSDYYAFAREFDTSSWEPKVAV